MTNSTHNSSFVYVYSKSLTCFKHLRSSSGELIVSIRHLVYATLCRWPSGVRVWVEPKEPKKELYVKLVIYKNYELCFLVKLFPVDSFFAYMSLIWHFCMLFSYRPTHTFFNFVKNETSQMLKIPALISLPPKHTCMRVYFGTHTTLWVLFTFYWPQMSPCHWG
jgi:hypothetical protein